MARQDALRHGRLLVVCARVPRLEDDQATTGLNPWRLLTIASRTQRVHLAALLDGGLRLPQWRRLARRTEKLAIVNRGLLSGRARLRRQVQAWAQRAAFDAIVCDDPALWPLVEPLRADLRACAVPQQPNTAAGRLPPDVFRLTGDDSLDRLADVLAPPTMTPPMPQVIIPQPLPLRRAA